MFNAYCYAINYIENKSIDIFNNNVISYNLYKNICSKTNYLNYCNNLNSINDDNIKINFSISPNMPTAEVFTKPINSNEYYLFDVCLDFPCYNNESGSCNKYI